ncbi:hybrid sensor histidine kinase/response regulator [Roseivirga sp. E12]|uniref:hybrid sensor histidine kinase/response regulator n=1 Tax=Roseivirga sp. E12 TaxID=2819237 RepID=UPI001ABD2EFF|nr:hybrid sensor histidine kinase/response regulator [Roseivirga sp. E12]MBO3697899.1 response regulator [Roseivirga sp. E12]
MRRLLLSVMLCYSCLSISAQSASPFFYQLFADYGLSSDKTTVSLQDYKGFLWFGTEEGLNRMTDYSEFDIYRYDRKDTSTLSNDHVTVLMEDSRDRLWVGTRDGLNLYNRELKTFTRVPLSDLGFGTSVNSIYDIIEDSDGDLWLISNDELINLDGNTLKRTSTITASGVQGNSLKLNDLEFYQTNLWVGTSEGLYELRGKKLLGAGIGTTSEITSLLSVEDHLWLGTKGDGLLRYNAISDQLDLFTRNSKQFPLNNDFVNDISLVDGNQVWVSTTDGINVLSLETNTTESYRYDFDNGFSLSDKVIREVYQDEVGSVWITTPNSGVNFFHKADNLFGYFGQTHEEGTDKDLMDYSTFSIQSSDDGKVWIGSRKGVSSYSPANNKFKHYPFGPEISQRVSKVLSIAQCSANFLWLGTDDGLVKWTGDGAAFNYIMPSQLKGLEILSVMADEEDNLWLGTANQGVKMYSSINQVLSEVPFFGEELSFSGQPKINDIKKFGNQILVSTEKGLYKFEEGALINVKLTGLGDGLASDIPINTVFQDNQNRIWLGTQQDGVLALDEDGAVLYHFDKAGGLASDDIRSIVQDNNSDLWLSTNDGVSKLFRSGVEADSFAIRNYDLTDGLQGNQFSLNASTISQSGEILMGGLSGITTFRPEDIIDYQVVQRPAFISASVNGEPLKVNESQGLSKDISMLDELVLNCEQNDFTINFSALDYLRPDDVVYRYKLKGYDQDWVEVKPEGKASYKNIPTDRSFDFIFQSKGRLSSEWSEESKMVIMVEPHYYQTFWFRSLIVIVGLGFILLLLWFREKRTVTKRQELEALVNARSSELRKEIGQRQEVEEALIQALVVAEDANTIKNNFLANMSHEIRTPLNGIIGLTEYSLDNSLDEEQKDILRTISSSATSLKLIVDDILDITKIESGNIALASEPYSVKELLSDIVSAFSIPAKKKDISVKYWVLPDVPPYVLGDPRYVRQVLTNLLSNAIKFTNKGGVSIFAEALSEHEGEMEIWFTVTDTGIGISEEAQEKIFDRFVQNDTSYTREYGGTGLGLSISKELVIKMGGDLWVESKEGKGSIFKFYVKSKEYQSEEQPLKTSKKEKPSSKIKKSAGRILVVEDNLTNQKVALKMLCNKGMTVTCVENGEEAIQKFKNHDFDLILMDLQMPVMDGYEATRQIRALEGAKASVPIIALTAAAMAGEREKCMKAGMDEYLTKPVSYKKLIDTVNSFLEGNERVKA